MQLSDSPFQKGLYIKVPKGTPLISRWGHDTKGETTSRAVVVEISDTALPNADTMLTEAEKDARRNRLQALAEDIHQKREDIFIDVHYPARTVANRFGHTASYPAYTRPEPDPARKDEWNQLWEENRLAEIAVHDEYKALGESRIQPHDVMVGWSKDTRWTLARNVTLAEKPEVRKAQPKVNIRQQMVDKSRWKFTQDVDIYYGEANPAYHQHTKAWDKANPRPDRQHRHVGSNATPAQYAAYQAQENAFAALWKQWNQDRSDMVEAAQKSIGEYRPVLYRSIKAGEIFTVDGKFSSYFHPHGLYGQKYGNTAIVVFDGETGTVGLEYSMIKDFIEAESIPVVKAYVLRHRESGRYYLTSYPDEAKSEANRQAIIATGVQVKKYERVTLYSPELADTFMKGKKWDNLGKAKTSILMMTGYYEGLPGADEALPEWHGGGASMTREELEEFDLVEFNKLDRSEVGVVADFKTWFKRAWELRELTVRYGSSVRTTYKALEKANLLDSQKGMIVFTVMDEAKLDNVGYWGDKTALTDEDKKEIELATASMTKGTFKKAVDHKSMAVSFPNKGAAMMFKLSYNGSLKISVLDLEEMKEAVNG